MRDRIAVPGVVMLGVFAAVAAFADQPRAQAQVPPAPGASAPANAFNLDVKPVVGTESLSVAGSAPGATSVTVTLWATYSRNMPTVVLNRRTIRTNADGAFSSVVPIAPGHFEGAVVTVVVTAAPGGGTAIARYTVGIPNVTVPPDNLPNNMK